VPPGKFASSGVGSGGRLRGWGRPGAPSGAPGVGASPASPGGTDAIAAPATIAARTTSTSRGPCPLSGAERVPSRAPVTASTTIEPRTTSRPSPPRRRSGSTPVGRTGSGISCFSSGPMVDDPHRRHSTRCGSGSAVTVPGPGRSVAEGRRRPPGRAVTGTGDADLALMEVVPASRHLGEPAAGADGPGPAPGERCKETYHETHGDRHPGRTPRPSLRAGGGADAVLRWGTRGAPVRRRESSGPGPAGGVPRTSYGRSPVRHPDPGGGRGPCSGRGGG
jgi:hypothetical protein